MICINVIEFQRKLCNLVQKKEEEKKNGKNKKKGCFFHFSFFQDLNK